jgi:hypothetical protein
MITSIRKYKMLILTGLLAAYLGGALQDSLLDSMHFVSHLAQEFTAELQHTYYNHQHQDGQAHTHRHIVLEVIDDTSDKSGNDAQPQGDQQKNLKKKNPEYRSSNDPISFFPFSMAVRPIGLATILPNSFLSVPSPPPKFFSEAA